MRRPLAVLAVAALAAACAHPAAAPPATPPARAPALVPGAVAGLYSLRVELPPPQNPGSRGRQSSRGPRSGWLRLSPEPQGSDSAAVASGTPVHYGGRLALPGFTVGRRGWQEAQWWPAGADSLVVRLATQRSAILDFRGVVRGDSIAGAIWYTSLASGASFQFGGFLAVRRRR